MDIFGSLGFFSCDESFPHILDHFMVQCLILGPELLLELLFNLWIDFVTTLWVKSMLWESSVDWEWVSVILVLQLLVVFGVVQS
jgi:hypothetical protein